MNPAAPISGTPGTGLLGAGYLLTTTVPLLAALWMAALGWGWPLRRWLADSRGGLTLQAIAGTGVLLLLAWLAELAGVPARAGGWGLCAGGWTLLAAQMARPRHHHLWRSMPMPRPHWAVLLALPAAAILLVAATIPPGAMWAVEAFGYDTLSYHLQVPREWLALGRMTGLHHNVFSYLPSLLEAGYMLIGGMSGSMYEGIYAAQLFHASLALAAAAAVGRLVSGHAGRGAGAAAAAAMLAVPWTIITGSEAYNEMGVQACAAAAVLVLFDPREPRARWHAAALAGFLAGCATMAKLTAGLMVAAPLAVIVALGMGTGAQAETQVSTNEVTAASGPRIRWTALAAFAVAGAVVLAPYLARNAAWTGNPVFPFASGLLGHGHWGKAEVARWQAASGAAMRPAERVTELGRQWLCNAGYGALGGVERPRTHGSSSWSVANFRHEWGFPLFWAAAALGAAAGLTWRGRRRLAAAMLVMLACQAVFWSAGTHLQSRFMTPSLVPGAVLIGLGLGRLRDPASPARRLAGAAAAALVLALTWTSFRIFITQSPRMDDGHRLPPWELVDSLPHADDWDMVTIDEVFVGDHPLNYLPAGSKTLLLADVSRLLYIRGGVVYNTAFDPNPLGQVIRQTGGEPDEVNAALRALGVTHVWLNRMEFDRLRNTYGFDESITPAVLQRLTQTWKPLYQQPNDDPIVHIYALP